MRDLCLSSAYAAIRVKKCPSQLSTLAFPVEENAFKSATYQVTHSIKNYRGEIETPRKKKYDASAYLTSEDMAELLAYRDQDREPRSGFESCLRHIDTLLCF